MISSQSNKDLSYSNTLNLPCIAEHYIELEDEVDLIESFNKFSLDSSNYIFLGEGSNLILPPIFKAYVLRFKKKLPCNASKILEEDDSSVLIEVEAGVNWDAFVEFTVSQNLVGLENLSLIPGTVGAAPIQNIGAYGVEICNCLEQVIAFNVLEKRMQTFNVHECLFGYRDSLFKRRPGEFIISKVQFRLSKKHHFVLEYGELQVLNGLENISSERVRQTVIETRQAKLPDPKKLPNAGSFFKNPVIEEVQLAKLLGDYPNIVHYPLPRGFYKLAAAWLIDQAGWKGFRNAKVGVHDKQALVIINHHQGNQSDIIKLAKDIQKSVFNKFAVTLEIEPVLINA